MDVVNQGMGITKRNSRRNVFGELGMRIAIQLSDAGVFDMGL